MIHKLKTHITSWSRSERALIFALTFAAIGALIIVVTNAQIRAVGSGIETENGVLSGNARKITDNLASNGRAVIFTEDTPPPPSCSGVNVNPGDSIQAKVDANPAGTLFCLQSGTYRLQSVVPKNDMKFIGYGSVVLNGSKLLTNFSSANGIWYAGGQSQRPYRYNQVTGCNLGESKGTDTRIVCRLPEDLFIDNAAQVRVTSLSAVTAGKWYFDYTNSRVYIGTNPSGKKVELSVKPYAFSGVAPRVEIKNITVEKYANYAQTGAIMAGLDPWSGSASVSGWKISGVTSRLNHGAGIAWNRHSGIIVDDVLVTKNGQIGLKAKLSSNFTVKNSELSYNHTLGFPQGWEHGGTKFSESSNFQIINNKSHDNKGPGLWTDIENQGVLYEGNQIWNNTTAGIFHEISYSATIRNNAITNNGHGRDASWCYGAGIQISASRDVTVQGNTVTINANGIVGLSQTRKRGTTSYYLRNLKVYSNTVTSTTASGAKTGVCDDIASDDSVFQASSGMDFEGNTYSGSGNKWKWLPTNQLLSLAQWKSYGHDNGNTSD